MTVGSLVDDVRQGSWKANVKSSLRRASLMTRRDKEADSHRPGTGATAQLLGVARRLSIWLRRIALLVRVAVRAYGASGAGSAKATSVVPDAMSTCWRPSSV